MAERCVSCGMAAISTCPICKRPYCADHEAPQSIRRQCTTCDEHFRAWTFHPLTASATDFQDLEDRLTRLLHQLFAAGAPGSVWSVADSTTWPTGRGHHPSSRRRVYEVIYRCPDSGTIRAVEVYPGWRWQTCPDFDPGHLAVVVDRVESICELFGLKPA